jgi:hypothetical protein
MPLYSYLTYYSANSLKIQSFWYFFAGKRCILAIDRAGDTNATFIVGNLWICIFQ